MCGIAVAINWDGAEAAVRAMLQGILHRGDVTDPIATPATNTAMGTRRLRIVDADHGEQPQWTFDQRIVVAFNGEIYNYRELQRELIALGMKFRTDSDTEVLAAAIHVWGIEAMQHLIGMFAFVAVDIATGQILAARDPLGIKPLYFVQSGQGLLFCSEIKPLLNVTRHDLVGVVPPGCMITKGYSGPYKSRLKIPANPPVAGDVRELDQLMAEAVRIRLPEGLPVACMTSGGIDSTLVTHYARQVRPEIPGYFIGSPAVKDYPYVMDYARKSDLDLRQVTIDPAGPEIFSYLDTVIEHVETFEPGVVRSALCTYLVGREMHKDGFRVALCGDGADELFCGYLPLEMVFAEGGNELGQPVRNQYMGYLHRTELQRVDRCTMAHEVEMRVPFLDPAVVNFGNDLQAASLVSTGSGQLVGKAILRQLYDLYPDQLPISIRDRQKTPFSEGAGFGTFTVDANSSPFSILAEETISDADLADGQKRFAAYRIVTKEELMYIRVLAGKMDIDRVPEIQDRPKIVFPSINNMDRLKDYKMEKAPRTVA